MILHKGGTLTGTVPQDRCGLTDAMGRDVMDETVEWWGKQAEDVREEALGDDDRIDLEIFHQAIEQMVCGSGCVLVPRSVV